MIQIFLMIPIGLLNQVATSGGNYDHPARNSAEGRTDVNDDNRYEKRGGRSAEGGKVTKDEVLNGLKAGRKLRCDRKDEPLLPWLLNHPNIDNKFIQHDEQSSCIEFWWRAGDPPKGDRK